MKRKLSALFWLSSFLMAGATFGGDPDLVSCRGGDGPHPFLNLTPKFSHAAYPIQTPGSVRDFIYWPRKNAVVVSNDQSDAYEKNLKTSRVRFLTHLDKKMSRVTDPGERVILTDKDSWYFDADQNGASWQHFNASPWVKHMYWHRKGMGRPTLYSVSQRFHTGGTQKLDLLSYRFGQENPSTCALAVQPGEFYRVGEGHQFPYVFLYKVTEHAGIYTVSFYEMLAETISGLGHKCDVRFIKTLPQGIPGEIRKVYQFADGRTFAVHYETQFGNEIYWDSPRKQLTCDYGEKEPVIPNTKVPMIVSWQHAKGVRVLMPELEAEAELLTNLSNCSMKKDDLWISDEGERLIVRAFNEKWEKQLFMYSLKHH